MDQDKEGEKVERNLVQYCLSRETNDEKSQRVQDQHPGHSMSLLAQKEVVRTDLQPFEQETEPLAKIWCVKMEEDTQQPNELNSQMRVTKTYLMARYRLLDLLRAQRNDRMTSNLKKWIEKGSLDKGDLEEDSYRILRQYFMQKEGR